MADKLLTLKEVSQMFDVSETTVKRWAREHLLKSEKQGNDVKFPETDVLKYKQIHDQLHK